MTNMNIPILVMAAAVALLVRHWHQTPRWDKVIVLTNPPYNADRIGVTNADEAIAQAIANATGKTKIFFPSGTYKITHAIRLDAQKQVTFVGESDTVLDSSEVKLPPNAALTNLMEGNQGQWQREDFFR